MASKVKMLKLLQEIRGFADITNRRPPPRCSTLVLTQIRANSPPEAVRRRKLSVTFDKPPQPDLPHQVKINHVKPSHQTEMTLRAP